MTDAAYAVCHGVYAQQITFQKGLGTDLSCMENLQLLRGRLFILGGGLYVVRVRVAAHL